MGITLDLQCLEFALLVGDHDVTSTGFDKAIYSPSALICGMGETAHRITLSWEDCFPRGQDHHVE